MPNVDVRILILLLWGGGCVLFYGIVLAKRLNAYRKRADTRNRRALISGFGLFLTALSAALAVALVLFGTPGTGIRGLFTGIALGAFVAAGFVMATEEPDVETA